MTKKEFCYINFVLKIEPSRFRSRQQIWFSFQFPVWWLTIIIYCGLL